MSGVYVCGVPMRYQRRYGYCPNCDSGGMRVVWAFGSPYYAPTIHCVECGDSWSDEGLLQRPFARGWRKRAIERHTRLWENCCGCPLETDADHYPKPCAEHSKAVSR